MLGDEAIDHLLDDQGEGGPSYLADEEEPNESEAETEILHASKSNTPRKPMDKLRSTATTMQKGLVARFETMASDVKMEGEGEPYMDQSNQIGLKRKARVSDLEQSQNRGRDGLRSPTKKVRLSPEYREVGSSSSSESEYEPTLDLKSRQDLGRWSSGGGAGDDKRRHRETHVSGSRDHTGRNKPARFASPSSSSLSLSQSYRASSHEVRPRSTSPQALHKRSSSFQSGLPILEPARPVRTSRRSHPPLENNHDAADRRLRSSLHQVQSTDSELHVMSSSRGIDHDGRTQLWRACAAERVDKIKDLLTDPTVDVNRRDFAGTSPLHVAASMGNMEVVQLLLQYTGIVDLLDDDSETPLVQALQGRHGQVALLLLEKKASPWQKDGGYKMPMDWADALSPEESGPAVRKAILDSATAILRQRRPESLEGHLPVLTVRRAGKTYHGELTDLKRMEGACRVGNEGLFNEMLAVRTVPNMDCALAAAKGGHVVILRRIVEKLDLSSAQLGQIMLASLGRGNLDVVQYMLSRPDLNANEKFDGFFFSEIAERRKGPEMYKEKDLLVQAGKSGNRSGLTADVSSMNVGSSSDHRRALAAVEEETEAVEEGGRRDKRRRLVTGAQRAQEAEEEERRTRANYLDSLPPGLKHALTPPHVPTKYEIKDWEPEERKWKRTLDQMDTWCHIRKRSSFDPSPPRGTENDKYIPNIWPTTYLRHDTLDKCKELMPTLPFTDEDRTWLADDTDGITCQFLAEDENWQAASSEILETRNCPHRVEYYQRLGRRQPNQPALIATVHMEDGIPQVKEWIKHAGPNELYWVKLEEFIELSKGCEWLKKSKVRLIRLDQFREMYRAIAGIPDYTRLGGW